MISHRIAALVIAGLLAGCASGVPVERAVVVPGDRFTAVQGEADLIVRTFIRDQAGERHEVTGAVCDLRTSLFEARLTTPSELVLPNFGPESPQLNFNCRADELTGAAQQQIVTRWSRPPGYWGWPGPYGPWGGWYGPGYPISDYPNLEIELR